jgi:hypothetical protein
VLLGKVRETFQIEALDQRPTALLPVRALEQNDEIVTPEMADKIHLRIADLGQQPGDETDHAVALAKPVDVVVGLEVIEVGVRNDEWQLRRQQVFDAFLDRERAFRQLEHQLVCRQTVPSQPIHDSLDGKVGRGKAYRRDVDENQTAHAPFDGRAENRLEADCVQLRHPIEDDRGAEEGARSMPRAVGRTPDQSLVTQHAAIDEIQYGLKQDLQGAPGEQLVPSNLQVVGM